MEVQKWKWKLAPRFVLRDCWKLELELESWTRTHRVMRLAQAGCMTTPSDVPRSQTEIGTEYVAANSLIYFIRLTQLGPLPPPPLFKKQSRAE